MKKHLPVFMAALVGAAAVTVLIVFTFTRPQLQPGEYFRVTKRTYNTVTIKVHDNVIFEELERKHFSHCIVSAGPGGLEESVSSSCVGLDNFLGFTQGEQSLVPFIKNPKKRTITIGDATRDKGFDPKRDISLFNIGCASCTTSVSAQNFPVIDPETGQKIEGEFYGL